MVTEITTEDERTAIVSRADGRCRLVMVDATADTEAASRLLGTVRRIDRVTIEITDAGHRAKIRGRHHRLPFSRMVPLGVALGLVELGVPATVRGGTP